MTTTTSLRVDASDLSSPSTHSMAINSPAFESTLTSYATRIIKMKAPPSAVIDSSLGPYVTSILRAAISDKENSSAAKNADGVISISALPEHEALLELLMEQCEMESDDAYYALSTISKAIQTGEFIDFGIASRHRSFSLAKNSGFSNGLSNGFSTSFKGFGSATGIGIGGAIGVPRKSSGALPKFRSMSMGAEHDVYSTDDAIRLLGDMLKETVNTGSENKNDGTSRQQQRAHRASMDSTLPDWSVAKRQDSPDRNFVDVIEEEPSFLDQDDTPIKSFSMDAPTESTSNSENGGRTSPSEKMNPTFSLVSPAPTVSQMDSSFLSHTLTPLLTEEEKKVAEGLKNLAAPTFSFTPLKQDQLIPIDLLGVIDDPVTPAGDLSKQNLNVIEESKEGGSVQPEETKTNDEKESPMKSPLSQLPLAEILVKSSASSETPTKPQDVSKLTTIAAGTPSKQIPNQEGPHNLPTPQAKPNLSGKSKKKAGKKDNDLAAALFGVPRKSSINYGEKSPKLKPMAPPPASHIGLSGLKTASADALMRNSIPALFQKQLDSAVEILLAMNYDVCREAAHEAALVSNADVNVAQHVIDGALSAPPVCRHMLNDGCYRSDCHFSHDVDGHTCTFWLRGRCGKGEGCRFMHGFSEKLLDGVNVDFRRPPPQAAEEPATFLLPPAHSASSKPIAIKTGNLVQHNVKTSFSMSNSLERGFAIPQAGSAVSSRETSISDGTIGSSVDLKASTPLSMSPASGPKPANSPSTFSFASIASKGYSKQSSFNKSRTSTGEPSGIEKALNETKKIVKIPQNLWTASQYRASGAFNINDPIARYKEVSSAVQRADVLDLHFQSMKTFPTVLNAILPGKLKDHSEVWIVTGTGNHVGRSTHQKSGGVLENAVIGWLESNGYNFSRGKDKNGFGGALLVRR